MYCVHCGQSNEEGIELCVYCGKPMNDLTQLLEVLDEPLEDKNPKALIPDRPFCVHCGKPNDPTADLCVYCGKPLNDRTQLLEILDERLVTEDAVVPDKTPVSYCVHCGKPNDPSEALCAFCGKPLNDRTQMLEVLDGPLDDAAADGIDNALPAEEDRPLFCGRCGQRLFEDSAFCAICGTPVSAFVQQQAASPQSAPQNEGGAQQAVGEVGSVLPCTPSTAVDDNAQDAQGRSKKEIAVIVILLIVIAAAVAVSAYFLLR